MKTNYLSKRRIKTLNTNQPIELDFDVCSKKTIDEYQKAIEFVDKYNHAYRTRDTGLPQPDSSIWDLRYEITARKKYAKERKCTEGHPMYRQIETRMKVLIKHLLFKHKKISYFDE